MDSVLEVGVNVRHDRVEVHGCQRHLHADLGQIVAHEVRHGYPERVAAVGPHHEADLTSLRIFEKAVAVGVLEPHAGQQFFRGFRIVIVLHHIRRVPRLVAARGLRPVLLAVSEEDTFDHGIAIDGHRDRTPEVRVVEPLILHRIHDRRADTLAGRGFRAAVLRLHLIEIEPEHVRGLRRTEVVQGETAALLVVFVPPVVLGLHIVERVGAARSELQVSSVLVGNDEEHELVEVRKPLVVLIEAVVVRISDEDGFFVRDVLTQAPRPARHELLRRSADVIGRREAAALERIVQRVFRHDGQIART